MREPRRWLVASLEKVHQLEYVLECRLTVLFKNNLSGSFRSYEIRWIGPDGSIFQTTPEKTKWGSNSVLITSLAISGDEPSRMPGPWTVQLYFEEVLLLNRTFTILPESE